MNKVKHGAHIFGWLYSHMLRFPGIVQTWAGLAKLPDFIGESQLETPRKHERTATRLRGALEGGKDTHMFVLAVEVSHSPTKPTMSNPVDSWLKNLG